MGKRELLLIAVFAVVGVTVYQLTAPPPAPGARGFSLRGIFENMRRGVQGNRASAEATNRASRAVEPDVTELRVDLLRGPITITGEDRPDIEGEVVARSNGFDEAEARRLAGETVLEFERTGTILLARVKFPVAGRQTARLALKVPARLRVRLDGNSGALQVSNVDSVELAQARGETTVRNVRARVSGAHRGGELTIANAGSLRLSTRGTDVRLEQIRGETVLTAQAGEVKATGLAGTVEIESNAADVSIDGLDKATGVLRINAVAGSIDIKGLRTEARIDLRSAELDLSIDRAAPVAIYAEGDERITITAPPDGFRLDAVARRARIATVPDGLPAQWGLRLDAAAGDQEHRFSGDVKGGGPLITIRSERGDITVRAREGT